MKTTGKHPYRPDFAPQLTIDEFMEIFDNNQDTFKHLQVFMSKSGKTYAGDMFVFLGRNSLGLVRLEDVSYKDENIILDLFDFQAKRKFRLPIDIHRRGFQVMFWKLDDIREMISEYDKTSTDCHFDENKHADKDVPDLLELDESQT